MKTQKIVSFCLLFLLVLQPLATASTNVLLEKSDTNATRKQSNNAKNTEKTTSLQEGIQDRIQNREENLLHEELNPKNHRNDQQQITQESTNELSTKQTPPTTFHIEFLYIKWNDSIDTGTLGDVFFNVTVENEEKNTSMLTDFEGWMSLELWFDVSDSSTYEVYIECLDGDGGISPGSSETADIDPTDATDKVLHVTYDRSTDSVSGEDYDFHVDGSNDGTEGTDDNDATIYYDISVAEDDPYEQNDELSTAYDFSPSEETWLSSISGAGVQIDGDWYQIQIDHGYEHLEVNLTFIDAEGDIDLALYDSTGSLLTASQSTTDNESIAYNVPASGTYYLRVFFGDQGNSYDLCWNQVIDAWNILVYMDGDNNLEAAAIDDYSEMAEVGTTSRVNIITQFDRTAGYDTSNGDWTGTKRFVVQKDEDPTPANAEQDLGEVNMGDPNSLYNFVKWGVTNFPANHTMLVLWDHGGGIEGACWDEDNGGDALTLGEIQEALGEVEADTGKHLDILGLDACLMAMTEVAYQFHEVANYFVGSQEVEPGDGWPYHTILGNLTLAPTATNPEEFAGDIAYRYAVSYAGGSQETADVTQSAIDLANVSEKVVPALSGFAKELLKVEDTYYTEISNAIDAAKAFSTSDFKDLYNFTLEIYNRVDDPTIDEVATDLLNAIADSVVHAYYTGATNADAYGLSIYLPLVYDKWPGPMNYDRFTISERTMWNEFSRYEAGASLYEPYKAWVHDVWFENATDTDGDGSYEYVDIAWDIDTRSLFMNVRVDIYARDAAGHEFFIASSDSYDISWMDEEIQTHRVLRIPYKSTWDVRLDVCNGSSQERLYSLGYNVYNVSKDLVNLSMGYGGQGEPIASIVGDSTTIFDNTTIQVDAMDVDGSIKEVLLSIDNHYMVDITENYNTTSGYYEYEINASWFADGIHTIKVKVTDNAGKVSYGKLTYRTMFYWSHIFASYDNILIVDDDQTSVYEEYYLDAYQYNLSHLYNYHNTRLEGVPTLVSGGSPSYTAVIWFTGNDYQTTLTSLERQEIGSYLDAGGNLFISGQDIGYDIGGTSWYQNYLKATYESDDVNKDIVNGASSGIFDGTTYNLTDEGGAWNNYAPSDIAPDGSSLSLMYDSESTFGAGIQYSGSYRLVYFAFPFEAINTFKDRAGALTRILDFLVADSTLPNGIIWSPHNDEVLTTSDVPVKWQIADNTVIDHYELQIDSEPAIVLHQSFYTCQSLADGSHTITVRAYDSDGNVETYSVSFTVDTSPPSVEIQHPLNNTYSRSPLDLNATVSDVTSSVAMVLAEIGTENISLVSVGDNMYFNDTYQLTGGTYTLRIYANDTQGNMNATETVTFTVTGKFWVQAGAHGDGRVEHPAGNITYVFTHYSLTNDMINVSPGVYNSSIETFPLNITDYVNVTLQASAPSTTIINGINGEYGFEVAADGATLIGFTIHSADYGIYASSCSYTRFENNRIYNNTYDGVSMETVDHVRIVDNFIYNNSYGIDIDDSFYPSLQENTIVNHTHIGLEIASSQYVSIQNNIFKTNDMAGVDTYHVQRCSIVSNTFKNNEDGIWAEGKYFNITSNTIINNTNTGIWLRNSNSTLLENNNITEHGSDGIWIEDSNYTRMLNNSIEDNVWGIDADSSNFTKIEDNTIQNHYYDGIWVTHSHHQQIIDNTIVHQGNTGIWLEYTTTINITKNTIQNCSEGLDLYRANESMIIENIIEDNSLYGLYLDQSTANTIYRNDFVNNDENAYADISGNQFNNTNVGNYWDDYTDKDTNEDNIGDTPYTIPGDSGCKDYHPSMTFFNIVDDTAPSLTIQQPRANANVSSTTVSITWTGTDNIDISYYQISIDDGTWEHLGETNTYELTGLKEGDHTINLTIVDGGTNMANTSLTFTVDTTPPTVTIDTPQSNVNLSSSSVTLTWSGTDATSGIHTYSYRMDNGAWTNSSSSTHTFTLDDGAHTITIMAYDWAGYTDSHSITFTVDTTPPTVTIDTPQDDTLVNASSTTVTWSGTDPSPSSGILTYSYQLDAAAWTNITDTSHTFNGLSEGAHTVHIKVYDWAGNTATSSITFTIDTEDPSLSITSPEDGATFEKDTVTVAWNGDDTGSGIDHYEVQIDGSGWETVAETSYTFSDLQDGEHTVDVKAVDSSGKTTTQSVAFTVNTSPIGGPGMMEELLLGIGVAVVLAAVAALYFFKLRKQ